MSERIFLVGGGGHARSVIDVLEAEGKWSIAGFVDRAEVRSTAMFGYPRLGDDSDLAEVLKEVPQAVVAVGQLTSAEPRESLFKQLIALGAHLPVVVSPRAAVSPRAVVGAGSVVMHGAVVNAGASIGANCIINSLALIEHDSVIESHCHVSTGARVNGGCSIGTGSFVGSGAILFQGVQVSSRSVIPAGVVVKDSLTHRQGNQ